MHTNARLRRCRLHEHGVPSGWCQPPAWIPAWQCPRDRASKSELACSGLGPRSLSQIGSSLWSRALDQIYQVWGPAAQSNSYSTALEKAVGSGKDFRELERMMEKWTGLRLLETSGLQTNRLRIGGSQSFLHQSSSSLRTSKRITWCCRTQGDLGRMTFPLSLFYWKK